MVSFSDIIENIKDAFSGNRRTAIVVMAILIVMTIAAVVIVIVVKDTPNETEVKAVVEEPLKADQPLLIPPSPAVPEGYIYSRERDGKWTDEDAAEWFTLPSQSTLDELSSANDRIATDITEAAP